MEDGLLTLNPAIKPGKFLPRISKRRAIDPLSCEEVATLLELAKAKAPRYYPLFLCAARTGLRQGELLALRWDDLNFAGRFVEVRRNFTHGSFTTPKSGEARRVDMSLGLRQVLQELQIDRQLHAVTQRWPAVPEWVFCDERGRRLHHNPIRLLFHRLLREAGLRRVRFHDLRHTFASLLLQDGESPVYVKDQLGHSSIQITVDHYGHLIPGGNKQAVDRLDGESFATPKPEKLLCAG
jgi:integrase